MTTGFFWEERTFWHGGGNYAGMLPVGGLVQPLAGGLPENPETKRRLRNLIAVTGLEADLVLTGAPAATDDDLRRIHPAAYLAEFKRLSDGQGGELGRRTPFGPGGYEVAALSAGLALAAVAAVLSGRMDNAYALSRPPGHHCLPDWPNGFCLLANIPVAIEAARADHPGLRVAVLDWDVHHGNGTEAIYYDRADTLTISIHQDRNYPMDSGHFADRGSGAGAGVNLNIPLPPGCGHTAYLAAIDRLALPAIRAFAPDLIVVACGFDAAANDPLGRMLAHQGTFRAMTDRVRALAADLCGGRLVLVHEGGYSETYVPFCGHAVLESLSGSTITAPDPFGDVFALRQPDARFDRYIDAIISDMSQALA